MLRAGSECMLRLSLSVVQLSEQWLEHQFYSVRKREREKTEMVMTKQKTPAMKTVVHKPVNDFMVAVGTSGKTGVQFKLKKKIKWLFQHYVSLHILRTDA